MSNEAAIKPCALPTINSVSAPRVSTRRPCLVLSFIHTTFYFYFQSLSAFKQSSQRSAKPHRIVASPAWTVRSRGLARIQDHFPLQLKATVTDQKAKFHIKISVLYTEFYPRIPG